MMARASGESLTPIADESPLDGAIVIATDATHNSDGAVRVGIELSRRHGVAAFIISVVEQTEFVEFAGCSPADLERATRAAIISREGELAAQRCRSRVPHDEFHATIRAGDRVEEIVSFAQAHEAALIVLGVSSEGVLARLLHRHTALRIGGATSIPVLAVPVNSMPLGDAQLWHLLAPLTATPQRLRQSAEPYPPAARDLRQAHFAAQEIVDTPP